MTHDPPVTRSLARQMMSPVYLTALVISLLYSERVAESLVARLDLWAFAMPSAAMKAAVGVVMVLWVFVAVTAYVLITQPPRREASAH